MSDNRPDPAEMISFTENPCRAGEPAGAEQMFTLPNILTCTLTLPDDLFGPKAQYEDGAIYVLRKDSDSHYRLVRMRDEP